MRIGVLADTHMPKAAGELPKVLRADFKKVDLILHAGDLADRSVLDELKAMAPTEAVYGNMDPWDLQKMLPKKKVIKVSRFKIGLIHGWGHPQRIVEVIGKEFNGVDAIVFGHTHEPLNEKRGNVLYFNPGSATDKIFASYNSYGILEVNDSIKGTIIRLN